MKNSWEISKDVVSLCYSLTKNVYVRQNSE